jgi:hypothetical protein
VSPQKDSTRLLEMEHSAVQQNYAPIRNARLLRIMSDYKFHKDYTLQRGGRTEEIGGGNKTRRLNAVLLGVVPERPVGHL